MIIAIDIDNTWTRDPEMWREIVALMESRGHQVIIATGRIGWSQDMERMGIPPKSPIVFTMNEFKEKACMAAGYKVDIWIDDMPGTIQSVRLLDVGKKENDADL